MRIGLLADVHGNAIALEAVLSRIERLAPDGLYFLGDFAGYMPGEVECLELLERAGAVCQQGNHEAMLLAAEGPDPQRDRVYRLAAARGRLGEAALTRIATWPQSRELSLDGRRLLLVHGSPSDPLYGYVYADRNPQAHADHSYAAIAMAHTHRPFTLDADGTLMLNTGSVGLPRDVGRLASFAVYDTAAGTAAIHRVEFDVDAVRARWGDAIHEQTAAVLARTADAYEGDLIQ